MKKRNSILLSTVWKASKGRFFWMLFVVAISLIPRVISIYGLKLVADYLFNHRPFTDLIYLVSFLVGLEVLEFIIKGIYENHFLPISNLKIKKYINKKILTKIENIDIECYDNKEFYENFTLALKDADNLIIENFENLRSFLSNILSFIFVVFMIVSIDILVVIIPIVSLIILTVLNTLMSKIYYNYNNDRIKEERYIDFLKRSFYSSNFTTELIISPIKKLLEFQFDTTYRKLEKVSSKHSKKITLLNIFNQVVFAVFGFGFLLITISYRVINKGYSVGDFIALANAGLSFVNCFMAIVMLIPTFSKNKQISRNITHLLNYKNSIENLGSKVFCEQEQKNIQYKDVVFSYPFNKDVTILKKINLVFPIHKKTAIVGMNGSGKTTLIKLLLRLYDVTEGEILIGDNNIRDYELSSLRKNFGVLTQDFKLLPISIAENILMRKIESENDEQIVWESLVFSGLDKKVKELKDTIYTNISKEFDEDGAQFSGGEMQKLCLSKIFAQKGKIIILDEPSSALDPIAESYIFDKIFNEMTDRTIIFITHRLTSTAMADKIVLIKNGEVALQGTHNELMSYENEYKFMYDLQTNRATIDPEENSLL